MGIDVPVDLPDTVLVIKRPTGPQSGSTQHPKLHIPNGDYPLCGQNHDYYKEKSIKVYPPAHRDWCKNCIKKQREDYSMMREDILDYVESHPDATPKEIAEHVEGANPYTVRTVLDGEGIEPTEPEPMDGEDEGTVDDEELQEIVDGLGEATKEFLWVVKEYPEFDTREAGYVKTRNYGASSAPRSLKNNFSDYRYWEDRHDLVDELFDGGPMTDYEPAEHMLEAFRERAQEILDGEVPREDSEPDVVVISAAKPLNAEATMHQDPECTYLTRFDAKPRDVEREELEGDWSTCGHCWEGEDSEEVEDGEDDVDEDSDGDQEAESDVDVKHGSTGTDAVLAEGKDESVDDQAVEPGRDDAHELDQKEWLEVLRACAKQDVGDEVLAKVAAHAGGEQ